MPAARVCATPGCAAPAVPGTGRCPAHTRAPWRAGSSTRKATLPTNWRRIRAAVLTRDGYRCQCDGCPRCTGRPCTTPATDVDHIGNRNDHTPTNLRSICAPCHRHRSSKQGRGA